jgi:preprotein translocase subunit SecD
MVDAPIPATRQSLQPIPSILLVFQIQRSPGTTVSQSMKTTIRVFRKRLTVTGHGDATVTAITSNRLSVKIPRAGMAEARSIADSLMTSAKLTMAAQKIGTEELLRELVQKRELIKGTIAELYTRSAAEELYGAAIKESKNKLRQTNVKIARLFKPAEITDRNVIEAQVESNTISSYYSVALKFDAIGANSFTALTKRLAGTGRSIGIFVNDELFSSPIVDAQYQATGINGGSAIISGNFTESEAVSLALSLNSGQLPAPIKLLNISDTTGS